jgi:DNA-binding PadR family transcriptional regulator
MNAISNTVSIGRPNERTPGKYVKTTLDLVVLAILNGKPTHGYKIMADIHKEFGVLLSPGSLYPLLHLLEEKNFIESHAVGGKKVYEATNEGRKRLQNAFAAFRISTNQLENFVKRNGKDSPNDS